MFVRISKRLNKKQAFTVVELMIACLILLVLVCLAVPSFMTSRLRAEEQKAMVTIHAYAQAQKAYWFNQPGNANTYTAIIDDLNPYVDILAGNVDDGDWWYLTDGDANTFTVTAVHYDVWGNADGLELEINQNGNITRSGSWPYTVVQAP